MKKILIPLLVIISISATAQQSTIFTQSDKPITLYPYFKSKELLYFKTTSNDTAYTIPLSQLKTLPDKTAELPSMNPDLYIMKFRRGQLNGFWVTIIGASITSIGAIASKDNISPLVYGGLGVSLIGVFLTIGSHSNLKKYFIIKTATPYPVTN